MSNKAVFFDRDGTLIKEAHYLSDPDLVQIEDRVVPGLRLLQQHGFSLFIVTNQSGIARGRFSESDYHRVHDRVLSVFSAHHISFVDAFFCPHHPTEGTGAYLLDCDCRKPKPGMLNDGIKKYHISPDLSYMVGDQLRDIEAGQAATLKSILVRTGQGLDDVKTLKKSKLKKSKVTPDFVAEDVYDAVVNYILSPKSS